MKKIVSYLFLNLFFLMPIIPAFPFLAREPRVIVPTPISEVSRIAKIKKLCGKGWNNAKNLLAPEPRVLQQPKVLKPEAGLFSKVWSFTNDKVSNLSSQAVAFGSLVKNHPFISGAAIGVVLWGKSYVKDFLWLKKLEQKVADDFQDYHLPQPKNELTFKFYTWRLSSNEFNDQHFWKTAQDIRTNNEIVRQQLYDDLAFSGNAKRIFLKQETGVLFDQVIVRGERVAPNRATLEMISDAMNRELNELEAYMDRLTALDIRRLSDINVHIINRLPFTGSLNKKVIIDHLRHCAGEPEGSRRFNDIFNDLGNLSADQYQRLINDWNRYLNEYGNIMVLEKSFSWREKTMILPYSFK